MAAVLSIVGGVIGAIGSIQQANAAARAADYNAKVAARNRSIVLDQAASDAADKVRQNKRQMGLIRAQYGAAGIDLAGSPLDVLTDSALEAGLSVKKIQYQGEIKATEQTDQENLDTMEAANDRAAGPISAIGSLFGGVSKGIGYSLQAA